MLLDNGKVRSGPAPVRSLGPGLAVQSQPLDPDRQSGTGLDQSRTGSKVVHKFPNFWKFFLVYIVVYTGSGT